MATEDDKGVVPIGEGQTLLLNIGLIYLLAEWKWYSRYETLQLLSIVCVLVFTIYVLFHAFSRHPLSKTHRFILSLCSSIIFLIFSINHISLLMVDTVRESAISISNWTLIVNYFLLGVAAI
ncbi:MAG: hypothetical protein LC664_02065 [Flavobacteriales bacterium]|nr:hypothetical protein [Flavobacteriales bacterium]